MNSVMTKTPDISAGCGVDRIVFDDTLDARIAILDTDQRRIILPKNASRDVCAELLRGALCEARLMTYYDSYFIDVLPVYATVMFGMLLVFILAILEIRYDLLSCVPFFGLLGSFIVAEGRSAWKKQNSVRWVEAHWRGVAYICSGQGE